jgi:hypothetical protein
MERGTEILESNLFLIGTVHGDPQGYGRAVRLLEYLRPDIITVEISPFSVRYRAAHQEHWRRLFAEALAELPPEAGDHPALRQLSARIGTPFEWRAAHAYGRGYGVRWQPIDLSGPAREHLPRYAGELLNRENLRQLLETTSCSPEEQAAAAYRRARQSEKRPLWRPRRNFHGVTRLRESTMAARLRKLAHRGSRVAHLGGWEHMASWEDGGGIYELLLDMQPRRFFLDESDRLSNPAEATTLAAAGGGGAARS